MPRGGWVVRSQEKQEKGPTLLYLSRADLLAGATCVSRRHRVASLPVLGSPGTPVGHSLWPLCLGISLGLALPSFPFPTLLLHPSQIQAEGPKRLVVTLVEDPATIATIRSPLRRGGARPDQRHPHLQTARLRVVQGRRAVLWKERKRRKEAFRCIELLMDTAGLGTACRHGQLLRTSKDPGWGSPGAQRAARIRKRVRTPPRDSGVAGLFPFRSFA